MKVNGKANVSIFQPFGIGQRNIKDCVASITDGRVEIVGGYCREGLVLGQDCNFKLNLPKDICSIHWLT